jgi:hypothetical protein
MVISSILGPGAPGVTSTALKCGLPVTTSVPAATPSKMGGGSLGQMGDRGQMGGGGVTQDEVEKFEKYVRNIKGIIELNKRKQSSDMSTNEVKQKAADNNAVLESELPNIEAELNRGRTDLQNNNTSSNPLNFGLVEKFQSQLDDEKTSTVSPISSSFTRIKEEGFFIKVLPSSVILSVP